MSYRTDSSSKGKEERVKGPEEHPQGSDRLQGAVVALAKADRRGHHQHHWQWLQRYPAHSRNNYCALQVEAHLWVVVLRAHLNCSLWAWLDHQVVVDYSG